jgi:hypothetical protein
MSINNFNFDLPFPDIFPEAWEQTFGPRDYMMFRNLDHFKHEVSLITQKDDMKCDMSYKDALKMLIKGESDFPEKEQASIRNLVRSNLFKRGLITEEIYENFRYTTDGTKVDVDVGKYAAGEPDCVISPTRQYIDFFYELYISISYPWTVSNSDIRKNVAKLLATIEELERQHIFIKITLVLPINNVCSNRKRNNYFSSIPLFSHKEPKSVETMSSVVNDRLLRKFFFALIENLYGDDISYGYGRPVELEGTMNIGNTFNEIDFFENIVKTVGA